MRAGQSQVASGEAIAFRIKDAVTASGLGRSTIYNLIGSGKLSSVMVRGRRLILRADLPALLQNGAPL
jgi:excisionase family DNA binding protein